MNRTCGDCQLCCKLLPMSAEANGRDHVERLLRAGLVAASAFAGMINDFDKPAGMRCPHQKHHKGCKVYARRPFGCRAWFCKWLIDPDTAVMQRPDRAHYVIDENPDFVRDGEKRDVTFGVLQVWVDPDYPDAHRDPALRAYLLKQCEQTGVIGALVRLDNQAAMLLYHDADGWHERMTDFHAEDEHTIEEKVAAGLYIDPGAARRRLEIVAEDGATGSDGRRSNPLD